ncbi:ice nucleation protein, partial [Xanthomonas arboricola pv. pruni]
MHTGLRSCSEHPYEITLMNREKVLALRTCTNNMSDHCGLIWPQSGSVECRHWQPTIKQENGLTGLLWGQGTNAHLNMHADAHWVVCMVDTADIIWLGEEGMIKFPRAEVVYAGSRAGAMQCIAAGIAQHAPPQPEPPATPVVAADFIPKAAQAQFTAPLVESAAHSTAPMPVATHGIDPQTAQASAAILRTREIATYGSTLTGADQSQLIAGYGSTETAGNGSELIAGYGSTGVAGSDSTIVAGYGSSQTAGGGSTLTAGYGSTQTARHGSDLTAGYGSTETAGADSSLIAGYGSTQTSGGDSSLTAGYGSTQT